MPDPTIEAALGVGNVPAYRGQAYVVMDDFQLGNFGNRIPNFEFEVIKSGATADNKVVFASSAMPISFQGSVAPTGIPVVTQIAGGVVRVTTLTGNITYLYGDDGTYYGSEGRNNLLDDYPPSNPIGIFNGARLQYGDLTKPISSGLPFQLNIFGPANYFPTGIPAGEFLGGAAITPNGQQLFVLTSPTFASAGGSVIDKWYLLDVDGNAIKSGSVFPLLSIYDFGFGNCATQHFTACAIDDDLKNGWSYSSTGFQPAIRWSFSATGVFAKEYTWLNALFPTAAKKPSVAIINGLFYVFVDDCLGIFSALSTIVSTDITIDQIVADQCIRSGVTDYNISQLTMPVHGYGIKRQGSARTNIDQLQKYGYFDAVESDGVLKFPVRGLAPVATIPYDDIGAHVFASDAGTALEKIRAQETDLPRRISVNYFNVDADYQAGSEHAQRLITESINETTVQIAVAMDRDKAAQISDVLLFDAHNSRTQFTFTTTSKYALLEPADVINMEAPETTYTVRIISKDDSGPVKKFSAVLENVAGYSSSAVGGSAGQSQSEIEVPGPTLMQLLDIPLIRDQDEGAGFYAPMTGVRDSWRGASLLKSFDDLSFTTIGSVFNSATMGYATTTLGNWIGGNMFDEANTVDVTLYGGELVSADYLAVLNGANACVIGNEILQFKNAILIGTKQYRLTGLLRGRRGTEQHVGTHTASDRFILMSVAGTLRPDAGAAEIGAKRYYKPVSFGQRQTDIASTPFTNTAIGLKPYSPVNFSGGKQVNGDFVINWVRRTRLDGGWRDSVDVPVGETTEAYEIDIMSGATVKRTMTSSTPTVTYTAAMQTTDFGGAQSTLSINVYQMSSVVGRGFAASKTY